MIEILKIDKFSLTSFKSTRIRNCKGNIADYSMDVHEANKEAFSI